MYQLYCTYVICQLLVDYLRLLLSLYFYEIRNKRAGFGQVKGECRTTIKIFIPISCLANVNVLISFSLLWSRLLIIYLLQRHLPRVINGSKLLYIHYNRMYITNYIKRHESSVSTSRSQTKIVHGTSKFFFIPRDG